MNTSRVLAAEELVALVAGVSDDLYAQKQAGTLGLPSPRRPVAIMFFFAGLGIFASFGTGPAKLAAAVGGVVTLTLLLLTNAASGVVSALGSTFTGLASTPAGQKPTAPTQSQSTSGTKASGGGGVGGFLSKFGNAVSSLLGGNPIGAASAGIGAGESAWSAVSRFFSSPGNAGNQPSRTAPAGSEGHGG